MKVRLVPLATLPKLEFSWNFNLLTTDKEISKRHYNDLGTWHDGRIRPDVKYVFKHKCFEYKSRNHVVLCRVIKPCRLECGKQPLWTHISKFGVKVLVTNFTTVETSHPYPDSVCAKQHPRVVFLWQEWNLFSSFQSIFVRRKAKSTEYQEEKCLKVYVC